ncbi:MAG: 1-acyl-sn-glycerol-3-phosphate acyltransferase [Flavobacteriales bacterium]
MEAVSNEIFTQESIRPFFDNEVPDAIERLSKQPSFHTALRFVFPDMRSEELLDKLRSVRSIRDFQTSLIYDAVKRIVRASTQGVKQSGLENLDPKKNYLFISNHRDIVLDSAFLNYLMLGEGFDTTRIAIGSNLLQKKWIYDLVKLNKNFIVPRNVQARQLLEYSLMLSNYIRQSITNDHQSVWIAQREGRTKNGDDRTTPALLKMFAMSYEGDPIAALKELNIVPVSISFEIEPCDWLKAKELYERSINPDYSKKPDDDLESMKMGIAMKKGHVHYHFSSCINEQLDSLADVNKNDLMKEVATLIDKEIIANYKLFPNNYIAYDLIHGGERFKNEYDSVDKNYFLRHIDHKLMMTLGDEDAIRKNMLMIYAKPLMNKLGE